MREASFYCENCGKLVSIEESICPSCHNSFQAVRCPVCSFTGESALFLNGCPSCGYLSREDDPASAKDKREKGGTRERRAPGERRGMPGWLFPIIVVCLLVVIAIFAVMLLR